MNSIDSKDVTPTALYSKRIIKPYKDDTPTALMQ